MINSRLESNEIENMKTIEKIAKNQKLVLREDKLCLQTSKQTH